MGVVKCHATRYHLNKTVNCDWKCTGLGKSKWMVTLVFWGEKEIDKSFTGKWNRLKWLE